MPAYSGAMGFQRQGPLWKPDYVICSARGVRIGAGSWNLACTTTRLDKFKIEQGKEIDGFCHSGCRQFV
jgi:hypothetical protein